MICLGADHADRSEGIPDRMRSINHDKPDGRSARDLEQYRGRTGGIEQRPQNSKRSPSKQADESLTVFLISSVDEPPQSRFLHRQLFSLVSISIAKAVLLPANFGKSLA